MIIPFSLFNLFSLNPEISLQVFLFLLPHQADIILALIAVTA